MTLYRWRRVAGHDPAHSHVSVVEHRFPLSDTSSRSIRAGAPISASRTVTGSFPFLIVVALFITSLITANTVAVRILEFGPWITDAGLLTFPVAYIVGDMLTEVYGHAARDLARVHLQRAGSRHL